MEHQHIRSCSIIKILPTVLFSSFLQLVPTVQAHLQSVSTFHIGILLLHFWWSISF